VTKKTNTAPPKRGRPVEASTTNRRSGVGMAGQKMPRDRQRFFEIRAPRNTRNRRTALCMGTKKVVELPGGRKWDVLGFRGKEDKVRVV